MVKISSIFVAFLENMNFIRKFAEQYLFIHKNITPCSCKFWKKDFDEQYLQLR